MRRVSGAVNKWPNHAHHPTPTAPKYEDRKVAVDGGEMEKWQKENAGCRRSAGGRHLPSVKSKAKAIVDMTLDHNIKNNIGNSKNNNRTEKLECLCWPTWNLELGTRRRTCISASPGEHESGMCHFFSGWERDFPLRRVKPEAEAIEKWVTSNRKMYFIVCIRTFRFSDLWPSCHLHSATAGSASPRTSDLVLWH